MVIKLDPDGGQKELASERTDLALQRTHLAQERTVSSWFRTGLASIAAGLGIPRILSANSFIIGRIIGIILITSGMISLVIAAWRYWKGYQLFKGKNLVLTPVMLVFLLAITLSSSAVLGFVLLF